ncbi:MAG: hypothetical protein K6A41_06175 [Bacteroidales bacterium]|nr:hypothetical protein [Bacteroidales bacterium]
MSGRLPLFVVISLLLCLTSCHKPEAEVAFQFAFSVGNDTLHQDTLCYVNAAGNNYSVTEVQYFISKVVLTKGDGTQHVVQTDGGIHYVDADIPSTLLWSLDKDLVTTGEYVRVDFVFGLAPEYNINHYFVNPPENAMSWPEVLGGGYHHMKLNGRWQDPTTPDMLSTFNMHIGTGQIYEGGQVVSYVDNAFSVSLPLDNAVFDSGNPNVLQLNMNIAEWFQNPYTYNFSLDNTHTMEDQAALSHLVANGQTVFSVSQI